MSKAIVKKFFGELEKNSVLEEKLLAVMKEHGDAKKLISFAASAGFDFSEKDLDEFCDDESENEELADETLAKASGGGKYSSEDYMSSKVTWRCYQKLF